MSQQEQAPKLIEPLPTAHESFSHKDSELVIGLVGPTAADLKRVSTIIETFLRHPFGYDVKTVKVTDEITKDARLKKCIPSYEDGDYNAKINALMDAGNDLREKTGRTDILSLLAIKQINEKRTVATYVNKDDPADELVESLPRLRHAHIIHQLKHPDEVRTFRKVYGSGFYLIGVHTSYTKRLERFRRLGVSEEDAQKTLLRDLEEDHASGQHTRDTFALADAFISTERLPEALDADIMRILEIIFGNPYETPTQDEYCMFLAYAASLRSADLSRQVGAVLLSEQGDITSTGSNEVAKAGGGQYWAGEKPCCRDYERNEDSNERQRQNIIQELEDKLRSMSGGDLLDRETLRQMLRSSSLWDITEYGRSIHAEMEAILSCARAGISTRGSSLFTTTFPCHNCAKHIVDAGVKRVVFVEPYPKSRAPDLLSDSINIQGEVQVKRKEGSSCTEASMKKKVQFEPFIGISARRFVDLFSMHLTTGEPRRRKTNGVPTPFVPSASVNLKVPLMTNSYLQRESTSGYYCEAALDKI